MAPNLPAAVYCRISDHDDSFDKIENQRKRLLKLAAGHEAVVLDVFDKDDGITSWAEMGKPTPHRSDYERLVIGVTTGKFKVVFAPSLDRLGRNTGDGFAFRSLCAQNGVVIVTEEGSTDPREPVQEAMATVRVAFAQMEVAVRRIKQLARFDAEVEQGQPLWGVRPFGYNTDRLTLCKEEAELIGAAYKGLLKDIPVTLYSIQQAWNASGVRTTRGNVWDYASVRKVLLRPRNAGIVMRNDIEQPNVKAAWTPLIDRKEFEDVRRVLADDSRKVAPGRKPVWLLSGLLTCGICGSPMSSATSRVRKVTVPVYKCRKKIRGLDEGVRHVSAGCGQIDAMARNEMVNAFLFGPSYLTPDTGTDPAPLLSELQTLKASLEGLYDLVAGGTPADRVQGRIRSLEAREGELRDELEQLRRQSARAAMALDLQRTVFDADTHRFSFDAAATTAEALGERFDALPFEQKRELVRSFLDITVMPGRKPDRFKFEHLVVTSLNEDEHEFVA